MVESKPPLGKKLLYVMKVFREFCEFPSSTPKTDHSLLERGLAMKVQKNFSTP